jgi:hypothetical protein
MKSKTKNILHYTIFLIGVILMIGGIITQKYGASIVGLIIAAVNAQQMMKKSKK